MVNVSGMATGVVLLIVTIIVVFNILSGTATNLTSAGDNVSASGLPLASLFASNGVILLVFMAGILIAIISLALKNRGK